MLKEPMNCSRVSVGHQLAGWLIVLGVLAGAGCAAGQSRLDRLASEQSRLIDLTHSFGADTIVWPTEQDCILILGIPIALAVRGIAEAVQWLGAALLN